MAKDEFQDFSGDVGGNIGQAGRAADVFRLTLTAQRRRQIAAAMSGDAFGYSCTPRVRKNEDGSYSTVVFVRGDRLPALSAELSPRHGVAIAEVCNFSARLRAVPQDIYEPARNSRLTRSS
jgi:hypothetical protein